jgi:hypothetical protein
VDALPLGLQTLPLDETASAAAGRALVYQLTWIEAEAASPQPLALVAALASSVVPFVCARSPRDSSAQDQICVIPAAT